MRRILAHETTLQGEFPGYVYGKAQWIADGLAAEGRAQTLGFMSPLEARQAYAMREAA